MMNSPSRHWDSVYCDVIRLCVREHIMRSTSSKIVWTRVRSERVRNGTTTSLDGWRHQFMRTISEIYRFRLRHPRMCICPGITPTHHEWMNECNDVISIMCSCHGIMRTRQQYTRWRHLFVCTLRGIVRTRHEWTQWRHQYMYNLRGIVRTRDGWIRWRHQYLRTYHGIMHTRHQSMRTTP